MGTESESKAIRLSLALTPFAETDLVVLFRNKGGLETIRGALEEIAAPDLVTLMIGAERGLTGSFHGTEGFIDAWHDFTETFQHLRIEITDLVEAGPDVVYVETRQIGATATAGVEIDYDAAAVFRFRDQKLEQAEFHLDRAGARRAAGLDADRPSGD
jgi:ketosteroid isomerase-like protein